ncbi:MAG: hypothetical protein AAF335_04405, partial [Bacteroidota bacterium]
MTSSPTWSLFLLLMAGTCHQLHAAEEETYEQREEKKGSKIKKYIKPQYLIVTLFAIVGSSFFYFRYIKEGDKNPEKPLKDSEKDDLTEFIDPPDEAKPKKLNKKIKKEENDDDGIKEEPKPLFGIETQEDLIKWINSLKTLTENEKKKLVERIEAEEISGKKFLSSESQQEIEDSFQVDSTTAKKLYDALIKLKHQPKVGPNSGLIGLQNFNGDERNICYLNAAVQLLLQSPPLVKALRERQYFKKNKYFTKKENDPEQDMWAGFVELAQQAIQPNAQQASFNPTYIAT